MAWVISNVLYSPERLSKQPLRSRCPADIHILRGKKQLIRAKTSQTEQLGVRDGRKLTARVSEIKVTVCRLVVVRRMQ